MFITSTPAPDRDEPADVRDVQRWGGAHPQKLDTHRRAAPTALRCQCYKNSVFPYYGHFHRISVLRTTSPYYHIKDIFPVLLYNGHFLRILFYGDLRISLLFYEYTDKMSVILEYGVLYYCLQDRKKSGKRIVQQLPC